MASPVAMLLFAGFYLFSSIANLCGASPAFSSLPPLHHDGGGDGDGEPRLGAVASESSICSRFGTDMLEKGGNAADAVGVLLILLARNSIYG